MNSIQRNAPQFNRPITSPRRHAWASSGSHGTDVALIVGEDLVLVEHHPPVSFALEVAVA